MNSKRQKRWDAYSKYLAFLQKNSNRVWREQDDCPQIADQREDFRDEIDRRIIRAKLDKVLLTLTERERKVIQLRFFKNYTLERAAQELFVTRERIRQLECRALRKLRHPARIDMLVEPEEAKLRQEKRHLKRREDEKLRKENQIAYAIWWNDIGKYEHERKEEIRRKALREQQQAFHLAMVKETQEIEERNLRRIAEHREAYKKACEEIIERNLKQQEQDKLKQELNEIRDQALFLINGVRAMQAHLAQKPIARFAVESNENRPYIWDTLKKKKRYLKKDGTYE